MSKNADFEFQSVDIDGKHVEIIIIAKALGVPVTFEKIDYIRVGSYTKKSMSFLYCRHNYGTDSGMSSLRIYL